ncbi:hypothetical protein MF672_027895 [Actinomadura sp. ATCC 31491]|uniref:Uncharacterized protein n=1 Tax=Actinomadura luzonensis TaxID=2805427 RepID=A0ABT0FZ14_9ACTN|nr:hypothetical protein [Actinomadura luzonensis]MCK2217587.1 hypothetical protein [Actinomadura luzonensis]
MTAADPAARYRALLDLACRLEEEGVSSPATRELLRRPAADLSPADVTRLSRSVIRETGAEPAFALDPALWTTLEQALELVERDLRASGVDGPLRLVVHGWSGRDEAWVEFRGGSQGNGIPPAEGGDARRAAAAVAEAAQEAVMETTWRAWPVCPAHDLGLHVGQERGVPVWRCSGDGAHTVAPIGALPGPE